MLVFNTMSTYNKPKSAYKIKSDIEKNEKKYNISTVYRVIDFLVEIGVVHKLPTLNKYPNFPCSNISFGPVLQSDDIIGTFCN